jgi:hypothetical protein
VIFTWVLLRSRDHVRRVARARCRSGVVFVVTYVTPVVVPGPVSVVFGVLARPPPMQQLERAA